MQVFHPEHFCCSYQLCGKKLDAEYFQRDGLPYCVLHAVAGANLSVSGKEIGAPSLVSSNLNSMHTSNGNASSTVAPNLTSAPSSVTNAGAPIEIPKNSSKQFELDPKSIVNKLVTGSAQNNCELCGLPVIEVDTCYLGSKLYHTQCLSCFHCSISLSKSGSHIFKRDNHLYCKRDYSNLFLKICTACGELITDMCVTTSDEFFHSDCFVCAWKGCGAKLDGYSSAQGQLRCSKHVNEMEHDLLCSVCDLEMQEENVPVAGRRIHSSCLKCSYCDIALTKVGAKIVNGSLACLTCATSDNPGSLRSRATALGSLTTPVSNVTVSSPTNLHSIRSSIPELRDPKSTPKLDFNLASSAATIGKSGFSTSGVQSPMPFAANNSHRNSNVSIPKPIATPRMQSGNHSASVHTHKSSIMWDGRERSSVHNSGGKILWTKGQLIGKGSFGKVYMGLNSQTGQLIAVKQVQLNNDEDVEQALSLQTEISLMEKLRHPNIVSLLGSERDGDKFNILMEYVPGKAIDQLLETFGVLNINTIRIYTRQLLSALKYLHQHGVVHRDIKGKNILVDAHGNCKLCDFGSAKQFADILSKAAPSIGYNYTPLWTAPEVLLGNYGCKVDIWSLGCVIIEMATAKPPWSECNFTNPFRALYHIGNTNAIPLIPEWLQSTPLMPDGATAIGVDFLKKCFQRDPENRPDASELIRHPFVSDLDYLSDFEDIDDTPP